MNTSSALLYIAHFIFSCSSLEKYLWRKAYIYTEEPNNCDEDHITPTWVESCSLQGDTSERLHVPSIGFGSRLMSSRRNVSEFSNMRNVNSPRRL